MKKPPLRKNSHARVCVHVCVCVCVCVCAYLSIDVH